MNYRPLGRTGWNVSDISFGAWAVGGTWGPVEDEESLKAMHRAVDLGVNFFDTADVYGDGRSERLIRRLRAERSEEIHVATKAGRRLNPHAAEGYTRENLEAFIDRSRENLGVDTLDLLQLHCPPNPVYYEPDVFGALDDFVSAGKIRYWGVSVEKVEEAIKATDNPNCQSVQIIFNIFRQRPADLFFDLALVRQVGVIARIPLSSGMLTGKLRPDSRFDADDHRTFNREGAAFDKGETFSGVPYQAGLEAVEELRQLIPSGMTMGQFALRWVLMSDAVTCAIPGGKRVDQVEQNCAASDFDRIPVEVMAAVREIYNERIRPLVHDRW
ncbi:aldo/keto reductase [Fimbriimonas ginsengisoli]|uniref:Putative oxidoreductase n=1 Tax=Fimbriimonas ginsengisoli Gsoil 348 TaxID=661478 RepID=A0A068NTA9_FIMGI|nr:aldo/keto reductase [Fimbriimonas ginsengisoli]AIE86547.1 putative oxidoreductase [Fimbriimonas ginsengisoli Gsoil 348]